MIKRFTAQVPTHILNAMGWHNPATYAEVFDYFYDKGARIAIYRHYDLATERYYDSYEWEIDNGDTTQEGAYGYGETWFECADIAIQRAIDLI